MNSVLMNDLYNLCQQNKKNLIVIKDRQLFYKVLNYFNASKKCFCMGLSENTDREDIQKAFSNPKYDRLVIYDFRCDSILESDIYFYLQQEEKQIYVLTNMFYKSDAQIFDKVILFAENSLNAIMRI